MSLVSVLGIPPQDVEHRLGAPACVHSLDGLDCLQHPLHALLLKISLNVPSVCTACPGGNSPVSGGHSDSDTQDRVRQQPVSARGGAGTACISTQRVENREAGCGPPCISPALLSLTSSLLTSMFHTAIPPSEEQETSCLVSCR